MQTMEPDGSLGIEQCDSEEVPNRASGHTRAQEERRRGRQTGRRRFSCYGSITALNRSVGYVLLSAPLMRGRMRQLRNLTATCFALALGTACATVSPGRRVPSATDSLLALARLNGTIVAHTRHVLEHDTQLRLALGLRLDRLPSGYEEMRREDGRYARSVMRDLERIPYDALSQDDYLTLLAVHWALSNESEAPIYHALDLTALVPGASTIPGIARALAQHPIEHEQDVARYLYLLDNLGLFFTERRQSLREQSRAAITIPHVALDSIVVFLKGFRRPGAASPFALSSERLTRIDSLSRRSVSLAMVQRIDSDINVQLDSLIEYINGSYRAQLADTASATPIGLGRYPGGREYYQYLLRRSTTLDVSPADLYKYGMSEIERISNAMSVLRVTLAFGGSDSAFRETLRQDARFRIDSPNDFERRVHEALQAMRDSLRTRFALEVADSLSVVPRSSEAFDGARTVNLRESDGLDARWRLEYAADRITRLPAYVIPALVAGELVPGRYALLTSVQRHDSLPTIRQLMRLDGFIDGWSEHARALVGELGLYADRYSAYGALMLELEATARMVTDIGLHFYGWNYPEAVRYLRLHCVDPSSAWSDVLRMAVAEPGRAVAARIGSREFAGQRAWVRRQLGAQFDDGALQREIFRLGVLPLPVLGQHLTWYVWKTKQTSKG